MKNNGDIAREIFFSALRAADPHGSVRKGCSGISSLFREGCFSRLIAIGFGKASVPMAAALEEEAGRILETGVIITKHGHADNRETGKIRIHQAGHPVPDQDGLEATEEVLRLAGSADQRTLAVVLISGGGSALLVAPPKGIPLAAKQRTTDLLLRAGADIHSLNTVRKHISLVKGGGLARVLHPGFTLSLILSDVIGDDLDVIASGPTSPDPTTYHDALAILSRYGLAGKVPREVSDHLLAGSRGELQETLKVGDPVLDRVQNRIIGSNRAALEAAAKSAELLGMAVEIMSTKLSGEAAEVGRLLAATALERRGRPGDKPICLLWGGETVVTVRGHGKGGRNQELALSFAMEISGTSGITLLSAGTDGTDGPTDAAGAVVDGNTVPPADRDRAAAFLAENDSYSFFREMGGLLMTGPTGTNVMDIQIVIVR